MATEPVRRSDPRPTPPPKPGEVSGDPGADRMLAFARGDEEAFDEIVELYRDSVFRFFARRVRDAGRAEDLTQEVFLRIYRARASYRATASFRSWILTIAHRLALNELRAVRRRRRVFAPLAGRSDPADRDGARGEDIWAAVPDEAAPSPPAVLEAKERQEALRRQISKLPPNQRTALELVCGEELSYAEAARVMGVSVAAVRSLLVRARRALLAKLQRAEEADA
ncbi:MAG: RNA polymerase sigma factor [Planctomycetota bacterium]